MYINKIVTSYRKHQTPPSAKPANTAPAFLKHVPVEKSMSRLSSLKMVYKYNQFLPVLIYQDNVQTDIVVTATHKPDKAPGIKSSFQNIIINR
jgi:hypothetical protein